MKASVFLTLGVALCLVLFGDALLGRSLLAPLDIAAAQWPQYRFVDPGSDGIPRNHHIVDQLGYDLPLQWTVYHAWRRGEVPWWDPFTYAGRPLAADAHVSAFDPVRVACYRAFPRFELAYPWTRAMHLLLGGLGVFCLLRRLDVSAVIACGGGLLAMCAGSTAVFFGHPWIHASFLYYPWLWLAWHRLWEGPSRSASLAAPLLAAGALYAGNLQSHAYLPLIAIAFCAGYAWRDRREWQRALAIVKPTGIFAALLAAPVLWPEIELFALNVRPLADGAPAQRLFDGLLTASAAWPWSIGTFRTVMASVLGFHPGFCAFIGAAGFLLAVLGARGSQDTRARRCALLLVACFGAIMLVPPLARVLYPRASGLAVLGGIVLAAFGAESLRGSAVASRRAAWASAAFAVLVALGTVAAVHVLYPRVESHLRARMEAHAFDDGSDGRSLPLRRFQVANYPRETGFTNPEVLAAWLTLPAFAVLCAVPRWRRFGVPALLALNLPSPVLFARRFIPRAPIEQWQRLLAGGPAQQEAKAKLGAHLRLDDEANAGFAALFPQQLAHLHGIHAAHGYAALVAPNMAWSHAVRADFRFANGRLEALPGAGSARFSWLGGEARSITVTGESLNTLTLDLGDGPEAWLLRTDTRYPGWRVTTDAGQPLTLEPAGPIFTRTRIPAGPARVRFSYQPTHSALTLALAAAGLAGCVAWSAALARKRPLCAGSRFL